LDVAREDLRGEPRTFLAPRDAGLQVVAAFAREIYLEHAGHEHEPDRESDHDLDEARARLASKASRDRHSSLCRRTKAMRLPPGFAAEASVQRTVTVTRLPSVSTAPSPSGSPASASFQSLRSSAAMSPPGAASPNAMS